MKKKIIIAIDGFSSTGKSTLAKQLASRLGYVYVDTGAMYRAVTLFALQNGLISEQHFNEESLIEQLNKVSVSFVFNADTQLAEVYLNNHNVEALVRSMQVAQFVSKVAAVSAVRSKLVEQQQQLGRGKGIVMDGRDIGTVVFPEAELKIFMTASAEIRAQRRFDELQAKGQVVTYEEILTNVQQRDYLDTHREDSPLTKAVDAVVIDNTHLTREQQLDLVLALTEKALV